MAFFFFSNDSFEISLLFLISFESHGRNYIYGYDLIEPTSNLCWQENARRVFDRRFDRNSRLGKLSKLGLAPLLWCTIMALLLTYIRSVVSGALHLASQSITILRNKNFNEFWIFLFFCRILSFEFYSCIHAVWVVRCFLCHCWSSNVS